MKRWQSVSYPVSNPVHKNTPKSLCWLCLLEADTERELELQMIY